MKVVIITGGSSGIGQAAAREIAGRGYGVLLTYRGRAGEAADTVAEIEAAGGSAAALQLDIADTSTFAEFGDRVVATLDSKWGTGVLHGLVNNAGIGGGFAFEDVTEQVFDQFSNTLFKGPYFLTQRLLPILTDGGSIVNIGSTSALKNGTAAGYSSYAAQKGAIHTLTWCWAKELSPRRIRVNAVAPGSTRTRIADDAFDRMPEAVAAAAAGIALGRVGEPADIAKLIAFLISDDGAWLTGDVIECSGGEGL